MLSRDPLPPRLEHLVELVLGIILVDQVEVRHVRGLPAYDP
jgi:hypothetical protein